MRAVKINPVNRTVSEINLKDLSVQHINLPDADDGYGMLEWADGNFSYEIRGR